MKFYLKTFIILLTCCFFITISAADEPFLTLETPSVGFKLTEEDKAAKLISGAKERTITTVTARPSDTASDELIAKYKALGINIPAGTQLKKSTIAYLNMPTTLASLSKRPLMATSDITDETQLKKTINTITSGDITEAEHAELKRYNVKLDGDMYDTQKTKKLAEAFNKVKVAAPLKEGESRPEVKIMTAASDPSESMQRHLEALTIPDEEERRKAADKRSDEDYEKLQQIRAEVEAKEITRRAKDEEDKLIKRNLFLEKLKIKKEGDDALARITLEHQAKINALQLAQASVDEKKRQRTATKKELAEVSPDGKEPTMPAAKKRFNSLIAQRDRLTTELSEARRLASDFNEQTEASENNLVIQKKALSTENSKKYVERKKTIVGSIKAQAGAILRSIGLNKKPTASAVAGTSQPSQPGRLRRAVSSLTKAFKPSVGVRAH